MDKVEQIHVALQQLVEQRRRRKEEGRAASDHDQEEEDRLLSGLLSQLDSLKDSSSPSSSQAVEDQKNEGGEDEIQEMEAAEIVSELRKVKRQNTITHRLLSVMIIVTAIWQLSEVSILLALKDKFNNPFKAAGNIISGFLKGARNLQHTERLNSASKDQQLEASPIPPIGVPDLSGVDLSPLRLGGGED